MSRLLCYASAWRSSFPRVSGDEPVTADMLTPSVEFSPRERG